MHRVGCLRPSHVTKGALAQWGGGIVVLPEATEHPWRRACGSGCRRPSVSPRNATTGLRKWCVRPNKGDVDQKEGDPPLINDD